MPANDFVGWQAYFEIYPFTQDREDARVAEIVTTTINSGRAIMATLAGKKTVTLVDIEKFIPDYLGLRKAHQITDPLQRDAYRAFKQKLQDAKG